MMRLFLVSITFLVSASALAQSAYLDDGRAAMDRLDYDRAAALFEKAVAQTPNCADCHYWLGSAYGSQAQEASVVRQPSLASKTRAEFETAVKLDPNHLDARLGLVDFYMMAPGIMGGSETKAMDQANEIRNRNAMAGHRAFAEIYEIQKKPELEEKEFADAVREQPSSAEAHYWHATYLLSHHDLPAASAEFETSVRLDSGYLPGWFQIGHLAVLTSSQLSRGEQALKRYLTWKPRPDDPPLARAHYWLGGIYEKEGRKAEARSEYSIALRMAPAMNDVAAALKRVP